MPKKERYDGFSGANQYGPYDGGGSTAVRGSHTHELHVEHDGVIKVSYHKSGAAAKRALVTHLQSNGGTGKAVITRKGNQHGAKPVPATLGVTVH